MTIDWKGLRTRLVAGVVGGGAVAAIVAALAFYAPLKTLWSFTAVTGGASGASLRPGVATVLPASPSAPAQGRHQWNPRPRPPAAPQVPVLEPTRAADLARLNKKLAAAEVEIGKTHDLIASAKLPDGKELFSVAPRDGGAGKIVAYEPRVHWGGRVALDGALLVDWKGKVLGGQGGLLADLVRVGHLQLSAGPGGIYDPARGTRFGVLVHGNLCLAHCG